MSYNHASRIKHVQTWSKKTQLQTAVNTGTKTEYVFKYLYFPWFLDSFEPEFACNPAYDDTEMLYKHYYNIDIRVTAVIAEFAYFRF